MRRPLYKGWLPALIGPAAIFLLINGCAGTFGLRTSDSSAADSSAMAGADADELLRPEQALELAPRWMAEADSALAEGDSASADASMMRAILSLQGVLLDVPKPAQKSMVDTLSTWTRRYENTFDTVIEDLVATDEGLSAIVADDTDTLDSDSLIEELAIDSFEVVLDTTIVEVEALPGIPDTTNAKVDRMIRYFTENPRGRRAMSIWLDRAGGMIPRMKPILRQHGVPEDLVYLAMIESGFRHDARSWARAVGPWQFIYSTAHTFDLKADWWYDERRDPEIATHAAARFLRQLYDHLGDWYLALAAYNCGEGRVRREMRRSHTRDFWHLRRLPSQTRNYVPTYLAARRIAENPEKYGFEPIRYGPTVARDTVFVNEPIELHAIADALNIDHDTLRELNPALLRWCTPPNRTDAKLFVPDGMAAGFEDAIASIPANKKTSWVRHRVRRGETLSVIANKYNTSMRAIMDVPANHISNPNRISEGHYLLVPVAPGGAHSDYSSLYAMSDPELPDGMSKRVHTVRRGETLSQIAERYHIGLSRLLRWNNLHRRSVIYPGQKLVLYQPARIDTRRADASTKTSTAVAPPPTAYNGRYRVRRGDSPWSIAQSHGINTQQLLAANGLTSRSTIHPGDLLQVPMSATPEGAVVYQVQRGDTLWEIASRFDVSVTDLKQWNNIRDVRALRPGDRLIVHVQAAQG